MDRLEQLIARDEIHQNMCRYARGVDRRDWPAVRECYHDDAVDEHGEFHGTADGFIEWVAARHAPIPFSMHFLGQSLVEFLDDRSAAVETYFIAFQRRETANADGSVDGTLMEVFGRYVDRFEKRGDGVWRVAARRVVYDSTRTQPTTHHLRSLKGSFGQRDRGDPVYQNRPEAAE